MHNKGLVLGASSVVSSNNWVYASFARNRELAVVVESQEASSYFSRAFMFDWVPDTQPPAADAGEDVRVENPCVVVLDASGSWDDRAIAEVSWDLDGDGSPEADGPRVEFLVEVPGTHELWVEVTDAWGNSARDSVVVTMDASSEPGDAWTGIRLDVPWPLPAALSLIVAVLATARKLNLLRAITRGKG